MQRHCLSGFLFTSLLWWNWWHSKVSSTDHPGRCNCRITWVTCDRVVTPWCLSASLFYSSLIFCQIRASIPFKGNMLCSVWHFYSGSANAPAVSVRSLFMGLATHLPPHHASTHLVLSHLLPVPVIRIQRLWPFQIIKKSCETALWLIRQGNTETTSFVTAFDGNVSSARHLQEACRSSIAHSQKLSLRWDNFSKASRVN